MTAIKNWTMTCDECGFTTRDLPLMEGHSCDVAQQGGRCEDYPCCGHELGDCNGLLYGSDEAIKEAYLARMQPRYYPVYYCDECFESCEQGATSECCGATVCSDVEVYEPMEGMDY